MIPWESANKKDFIFKIVHFMNSIMILNHNYDFISFYLFIFILKKIFKIMSGIAV